jgi:hypothetical protein
MKQQFTLDSFVEAKRCEEFYRRGQPIAVQGKDVLTGEMKLCTGFVVSIESVSRHPTRVTIDIGDRRLRQSPHRPDHAVVRV